MKLNKSKNKGKVHPSPSLLSPSSSSSSSSSSKNNDPIFSLNHLLPTAILTLISVLSLQDREVLAYLISHSLKSSTLTYPSSSSSSTFDPKNNNTKKKSNKKFPSSTHKSPSFDCCCFDCYTSFWCRWNSSPHRELIDQAIEAFEEHLSSSEKKKHNTNSAKSHSKRREKTLGSSSSAADVEEREPRGSPSPAVADEIGGDGVVVVEERESRSPEMLVMDGEVEERENEESPVLDGVVVVEEEDEGESGAQTEKLQQQQQQQQQQHKGFARKVLPDVIGLFNSRLWNLWGPNV